MTIRILTLCGFTQNSHIYSKQVCVHLFLGVCFYDRLTNRKLRLALCAKLSRMPNSVRTSPSHKLRWSWLRDAEALPLQSSSILPSS